MLKLKKSFFFLFLLQFLIHTNVSIRTWKVSLPPTLSLSWRGTLNRHVCAGKKKKKNPLHSPFLGYWCTLTSNCGRTHSFWRRRWHKDLKTRSSFTSRFVRWWCSFVSRFSVFLSSRLPFFLSSFPLWTFMAAAASLHIRRPQVSLRSKGEGPRDSRPGSPAKVMWMLQQKITSL